MDNTEKSGFLYTILKGTGLAVISTLVGVLIFSGLIKTAYFSVSVIKPVNQFIKVIAVFLGCFFSVKKRLALVKGSLIGVIATVITYLLFALIGGGIKFGFNFIVDLIFALIIGGISGLISAKIKK